MLLLANCVIAKCQPALITTISVAVIASIDREIPAGWSEQRHVTVAEDGGFTLEINGSEKELYRFRGSNSLSVR